MKAMISYDTGGVARTGTQKARPNGYHLQQRTPDPQVRQPEIATVIQGFYSHIRCRWHAVKGHRFAPCMRTDCDPVIDRSCLQLVQAGPSLKIQPGIFRLRNQQAAPFQQTYNTPAEGVEQLCQFIAGGTAGAVKGGLAAGESVSAVQEQHVQVHIQIEGRAKTLNECHRSGAGA